MVGQGWGDRMWAAVAVIVAAGNVYTVVWALEQAPWPQEWWVPVLCGAAAAGSLAVGVSIVRGGRRRG